MRTDEFGDIVALMDGAALEAEIARPDLLRISRSAPGERRIEVAWAPFDHINTQAKLAIIGITPGREQMGNALRRYRNERLDGQDHEVAGQRAKSVASFSGPMRETLVRCLDEVGLQRHLSIRSCAQLWGDANHLVHFSSALRWPVFVEGSGAKKGRMENYTGRAPDAWRTPQLRRLIKEVLIPEIQALPADCLIAPLGGAANEMVTQAISLIPGFDHLRYLPWLPHPSGGNRDISSQFLGDPPSPGRVKPLNPFYRQSALALRMQIQGMARKCAGEPSAREASAHQSKQKDIDRVFAATIDREIEGAKDSVRLFMKGLEP